MPGFLTRVTTSNSAFSGPWWQIDVHPRHGGPNFSANEVVDYFQRLNAENGPKTSDFSRLFLVPGMGHCQGGASTDSIDGLGALVDWVEKGKAPEIVNARGSTVFPDRPDPSVLTPSMHITKEVVI